MSQTRIIAWAVGAVVLVVLILNTFYIVDQRKQAVVIRFGEHEVYPKPLDESGLGALAATMAADEVRIHVSLGIAGGEATVYGCDLSDGYIRINADYTT